MVSFHQENRHDGTAAQRWMLGSDLGSVRVRVPSILRAASAGPHTCRRASLAMLAFPPGLVAYNSMVVAAMVRVCFERQSGPALRRAVQQRLSQAAEEVFRRWRACACASGGFLVVLVDHRSLLLSRNSCCGRRRRCNRFERGCWVALH